MIRRWIVSSLLAGLLLALVLQGLYAAPPQFPFSPYGTVVVNGENVPVGTEIGAWCGGVLYATRETFDYQVTSRYSMDVPGDDPSTSDKEGCFDGETVTFTVDGLIADQTAVWVEGDSTNVDLTAFRPLPALTLEATTNGSDADTPPGPNLRVGDAVSWDYHVTNTGNVDLTAIILTDDQLGAVSCPQAQLAVEATMTCSTAGTVAAGQYANTAAAQGTYESTVVGDTDPSHYFGVDPAITVETSTNGADADTVPGPYVLAGDPVTWRYTVTNAGNATLTAIALTDDQLGAVSCPQMQLAAGGAMTCSASGTAATGQYANTATVTGTPPAGGAVSDTDPSHYYGADPTIRLEKATNGTDADQPPGVYVLIGGDVTWTYAITNTGNVALTGIVLTDDQEGAITCPQDVLAAGEAMVCSAAGTAAAGQYANAATVVGTPPVGPDAAGSDTSHYVGVVPGIAVEKSTNGVDADVAPGPFIRTGSAITWRAAVTNTGNVTLTQVTVTDDREGAFACPYTSLAPGASMICSITGTAGVGPYANTATVTAAPPVGPLVTDGDPSHYVGADPTIAVAKTTNGQDAGRAPGPYLLVGDAVTWTYTITNTGNVTLTQIVVTDDREGTIACPATTLRPDETMRCEVTGAAAAGQYANTVTAGGTPPVGAGVFATDTSHYFGAVPGLAVDKLTNGVDGDTHPGAYILVGDTVTWTAQITNTGNVSLTQITATDDREGALTCPAATLAAGAAMTCNVTGTAVEGAYANRMTVTGAAPVGPRLTADDPSHYVGAAPALAIKTATNGADADSPTGPILLAGEAVTWSYAITNTGNVTLTAVTVTDDQGVTVTCPAATLVAGATMTCTAQATAEAGQYANVGAVTGTPPGGLAPVTATDPSHYFAYTPNPSIQLQTLTNDVDADQAPGPYILEDDPVTWRYHVTNTGNTSLTDLIVTDDNGTPHTTTDDLTICTVELLDLYSSQTCTRTDQAALGQYANVGAVTGQPELSDPVTNTDKSHYFGIAPALAMQTATQGVDADAPPGPLILTGEPVSWTYAVTNTGNITLTDVTVTDDQGVSVTCPAATLAASAAMTCTAASTAVPGQVANVGAVTGTPPAGPDVSATDGSHYFGVDPSVTVEKATNGVDGDVAPGLYVVTGAPVTWTYVITNTGNVELTNLTLTDDIEGAVTCPATILAAQTAMTCILTGTAVHGGYANTATITGTPPIGPVVTDTDPGHYYGSSAAITVEKATNGEDADVAPGPYILTGDSLTLTYAVTNTGNVTLTAITVTDDLGVAVTCPDTTLAAGAGMACTAAGTAMEGQVAGTASVTGTPPVGGDVADDDVSHYYGASPAIRIEATVNGSDADAPPGLYVEVGASIAWRHTVTNTGNVTLTGVNVTDDLGNAVICPATTLDAGSAMACTAEGAAEAGQIAVTATATGIPPAGPSVTATDAGYYVGVDAGITITKRTLSWAAPTPPGPTLLVSTPVTWTYVVTNTGNATLTGVTVVDDREGVVSCPVAALDAGAAMTCTAASTTTAGAYANTATVTGIPPAGGDVTASDVSHYLGAQIALALEKAISVDGGTTWHRADTAPGPYLPLGTAPWFRLTLTNTGTVILTELVLSDADLDLTTCPLPTSLAAGGAITCTVAGAWTAGRQLNTAATSAAFTDDAGTRQAVETSDVAYYYGSGPSIDVGLATNGVDADAAPGPYLLAGEPVTWRYAITNTGNTELTAISVTDQVQGAVTCPADTLAAGAAMTCEIASTAAPGAYATTAAVTATPPAGADVTDSDPSHYVGVQAGVAITGAVSGMPASPPPGPWILAGTGVAVSYTVTNTGNATLTGITVTDGDLGAVACPAATLKAGAAMICTLPATAAPGPYTTTAIVTGTPPAGPDVADGASIHYVGADPALRFEKAVSVDGGATWHNADQAPGPILQPGQTPWFRFTITNTGNVTLTALTLEDDNLDLIGCELATSLPPQVATTCIRQGTTIAGQQANAASAAGAFTDDLDQREQVADEDVAYYVGAAPGLAVEKAVSADGESWYAADTDAGALPVDAGAQIWFRITVTNTGNVTLTLVLDDRLDGAPLDLNAACSPPLPATLPGGGSYQCAMSSPEPASAGLHRNVVTATGYRGDLEVALAVDAATYEVRNVEIFLPLILRRRGP